MSVFMLLAGIAEAENIFPSGILTDAYVDIGDHCRATIGHPVPFQASVKSIDSDIVRYKWDFNGDGVFDWISSDEGTAHHSYIESGTFRAKFVAEDNLGRSTIPRIKIVTVFDDTKPAVREVRKDDGISIQSLKGPDGNKKIYAIILAGATSWNWEAPLEFYNLLTAQFGVNPDDILFLTNGYTPDGYEDIVDGRLEKEIILDEMDRVKDVIDGDDMFVVYINWHGNGYIGHEPTQPRNISYHGYFGSKPEIGVEGDGDRFDFREHEIEWSIFCGYGVNDRKDHHFGMNQWGITWYPGSPNPQRCYREKYLSHFSEVYVEGTGQVSDNDVYIEKFTDYILGDLNHDGVISDGEVWDYDGDGIMPYDRETGAFDEDDWGEIDTFQDDWNSPHSLLCGIPFILFDADLDNNVDVDLYPTGTLEVDGTDIDNDGCIEGFDLNEDGDMEDWIAIDEILATATGSLTDDEIALHFNSIGGGIKVFITNTCYGGGFVNDLSGPDTIVIAGASEICSAGASHLSHFNQAIIDHTDPDSNGKTTFDEAFNFMVTDLKRAYTYDQTSQYDDNGDKISHHGQLPLGGDGYLGALTSLDAWPVSPPSVVKGDINDDGIVNLVDVVICLQVIAGMNPDDVHLDADVNGDEKIGIAEANYILEVIGCRR